MQKVQWRGTKSTHLGECTTSAATGNQAKLHSHSNNTTIYQKKSIKAHIKQNETNMQNTMQHQQNLSPLLTELLKVGLVLHFFNLGKILGLMK